MDTWDEWLGQIPLFAGVDAATLRDVARDADDVDVPGGTVLAHEGRYEGYFYVVVSGVVQIERDGLPVDTVRAGGFFGEVALLDAGPRTATVAALTDCRLLRFTARQFGDLVDRVPSVGAALEAEADRRLRRDDEGPTA